MKRCLLAGLIAVIGLAACAEPNSAATRRNPPPTELEYSCGGDAAFTSRDIEEGPEPSEEILEALRSLRQTMDGAMLPEDGWKVVSDDGGTTTLLARLRDSFASATFVNEGHEWQPAGWGDCTPRLVHEDKSVLRWAFTEESHPPNADATELEVLVTEVQCSSGRDIEGLIEPRVAYEETTIEVMLLAPGLSTGKNEAYTCIGTSPTEYTLQLEEPVADREVVDVSVYPAVEPEPGTRLP